MPIDTHAHYFPPALLEMLEDEARALGLSLVRHITRAHGGDVEVESTPGRGSKFTLSLPLANPST